MLSRRAVKILRTMKRSQEWAYQEEIRNLVPNFEPYSFKALVSGSYVDTTVFENEIPYSDECGETIYPAHYRISDAGLAYLEMLSATRSSTIRTWAALVIALLAMLISAIALVKSW